MLIRNYEDDPLESKDPNIVTSGNNIHVLWQEQTDLLYTKSSDGGNNFSSPMKIMRNHSGTVPQFVVEGNNIYIAWVGYLSQGQSLFFTKSSNGGNSFDNVIPLSTIDSQINDFSLSASGNNVYIAWQEGFNWNSDIYIRTSTNNGNNFGDRINVSNELSGLSRYPSIVGLDNNVYIVWRESYNAYDERIIFKKSTNNGNNFDNNITMSPIPAVIGKPQIAASGNNVYIIWKHGFTTAGSERISPIDIIFRKSSDGGNGFDNMIKWSNNAGESYSSPGIYVVGNNIYVTWHDVSTLSNIYFRKSLDGGNSFNETINLSNSGKSLGNHQLFAGENKIHVVWTEGTRQNNEVILSRSTDNGTSFIDRVNLSNTLDFSGPARVAAIANFTYAVWQANTTPDGNTEIFFTKYE